METIKINEQIIFLRKQKGMFLLFLMLIRQIVCLSHRNQAYYHNQKKQFSYYPKLFLLSMHGFAPFCHISWTIPPQAAGSLTLKAGKCRTSR